MGEFVSGDKIAEPGVYDVCMGEIGVWWENIRVYEKKGKLWLVNPENDMATPLRGIIGWTFRRVGGRQEGRGHGY